MKTLSSPRLLRYSDLVDRGLVSNRTTLNRWVRLGRFPAPIRIGPNSLAWREQSINEFLARCEQESPDLVPCEVA